MSEDPVDPVNKIIEEFFDEINILNQYYSIQLKQPVFLIGEKDLYLAIKQAIEKASS